MINPIVVLVFLVILVFYYLVLCIPKRSENFPPEVREKRRLPVAVKNYFFISPYTYVPTEGHEPPFENNLFNIQHCAAGPPSLPIYGAFFHLRAYGWRDVSKACLRLSQKYRTKVLGFYLSSFPFVVLHDSTLIKDVLNRDEFDGRGDIILGRLRSYWKRLGIFFTDGYFWHLQRRFSLRHMRDFGFGRRDARLEDVIDNEVKEIIDMRINGPKNPAEKDIMKGDMVQLHYFVVPPFINGICFVFSQMTLPRSEYHVLWKLARNAMKFQSSTDDLGGAITITPWLKDVAPNWSGYNTLYRSNQVLLNFVTKLIDDALLTHDESHNRHFIDAYLKKMKEEQKSSEKTTYSVDQLRLTCMDYLFPTSAGIQGAVTMLVERMLLTPGVQEKLHEEVDRVVGRDRMPTLDDRRNMPYTEACIREGLRMDPLVPLGIAHRATKDTEIGGYSIPENTLVNVNYASLHYDKEAWGDPENFRPERFLENGLLVLSRDKSLPFGSGHRLCPGETFSRQLIFQVFSGLLHAFHISPADGRPLVKPAPRTPGLVQTLPNFWVRLSPRY